MPTTMLKLVTIVAEAVIGERIIRDIKQLGARGYTVGEVRGEGTRGIHTIDWEGQNLRIETLVAPETARRILSHLAAHYFTDYAVIAYMVDAEVVRGEKYL